MNHLLKTDSLELFPIIPENVLKPSSLQNGESPIIAFTPNGVGEKIHIATVSSSTSDLTLYIVDPSHIKTPSAKKIAWGQSGYGKIQALTFDPLGDKLAVVCSRFLYILPFGTFMKPSPGKLSSAKKNVVEIRLPFFMSPVSLCSCIWWQTALNRSIIIIGTEKGEVYFIDVDDKKSVHKVQVQGHITRLELVPDDRQHITYLLISARSSLQWRLLLDVLDIDLHMTLSKERMLELGYKFYGYGGKKYIKSILHTRSQPSEAECEFKPRRFTNIPISVSLRYQSAKGCHLISGVDKADLSLKIYDSSVEHHPLYVYNLPAWTEHLVYTDRLIFCAFPSKHVLVLANQLSEKDVNTQQTGYVIHQYDLEEDESIKYMSAIKFPVTWHNELVDTSSKQNCVSSKHTILDGCLLVTNRRMIQFTPEFSPEQLFLNWSTSQTIDVERLHLLAQVTHIDFLNLYLHSADFHLRKENLEQALDCLHYSKCDDNSKVSLLYKYGEHELVVQTGRDILERSLTQSASCHTKSATSNICNMVLSSFLAILEERTDSSAFHNEFREFLLYNRSYSLDQAMKLLCDKNHLALLLEISLHRKFVRSALEHMFSLGKITPSLLHAHVENSDFVSALGSVASGSMVYLLNTEDFCTYLLNTNSIETSNLLWLAPRLHELDYSSLRLLAQRYHPHSKFTQSSIKFFTEYVESVSAQSYARFHQDAEEGESSSKLSVEEFVSELYLFYVKVVLRMSTYESHSCLLSKDMEMMLAYSANPLDMQMRNNQMVLQRRKGGRPVCCSSHRAYSLQKNLVFSWGSNTKLENLCIEERLKLSTPSIDTDLSSSNIQVYSISCGEKHLMILCSNGLQGRGSSDYGQLGTGSLEYSTEFVPVPLSNDSLSIGSVGGQGDSVECVDVVCGRYHTLAVDRHGRVYSWGWGVFGQLGHGGIDNQSVPHMIEALSGVFVVSMAAGHSHSMVLSHKGEVYIFGSNEFGQVNSELDIRKTCIPLRVNFDSPIALLSTKYFHNVAVTKDKKIITWGVHPYVAKRRMRNLNSTNPSLSSSTLSTSTISTPSISTSSASPTSTSSTPSISTSSTSSTPASSTLSTSTSSTSSTPASSTLSTSTSSTPSTSTSSTLSTSTSSTPSTSTSSTPSTFTNTSGLNNTTSSLWDNSLFAESLKAFRQISFGVIEDDIVQVECGTIHTLFLTSTGSVYLWEDVTQVSESVNSSTLQLIDTVTDAVFVSCDFGFSLALTTDGSIYSWGSNQYGQLGLALRNIRETKSAGRVKILQSYSVPSTQEMYQVKVTRGSQELLTETPEGGLLELASLTHLENFPVQQALMLSLSSKVYPAVIALFCSCNMWVEAFFYHLKHFLACQQHMEHSYSKEVLKILSFYLLKLTGAETGDMREQVTQLLHRALQFWQAKQLPVRPDLEEVFLNHLELLAPSLHQFLFDAQSGIADSLLDKFSSSFLTSVARTSLLLQTKKSAVEQTGSVWEGVVQMLKRGSTRNSHTTVTHFELSRLFELTSREKSSSSEVVVFTCGHNFTEYSLLAKLVPSLESRIINKLPVSGAIILEKYINRDYRALACPQCVYGTVNTYAS